MTRALALSALLLLVVKRVFSSAKGRATYHTAIILKADTEDNISGDGHIGCVRPIPAIHKIKVCAGKWLNPIGGAGADAPKLDPDAAKNGHGLHLLMARNKSIFAGCFLVATVSACAPQPFVGRVILEAESVEDMAKDARCQSAWDVSPGHSAFACSWAFPDPRREDGKAACHIVYEKSPRGVHAVGEEMYNCRTIDLNLAGLGA